MMGITLAYVTAWANRYPKDKDLKVFELGPGVVDRGFFTREEVLTVGGWKSSRSTGYLDRNTDQHIEDVTSTALQAPDSIKHLVLTLLQGVRVPMASAMLTVCYPDRFTIRDVRALRTLRAHGVVAAGVTPEYVSYVDLCRSIARDLGIDLRTLDRAFYMANGKVEHPPEKPSKQ